MMASGCGGITLAGQLAILEFARSILQNTGGQRRPVDSWKWDPGEKIALVAAVCTPLKVTKNPI